MVASQRTSDTFVISPLPLPFPFCFLLWLQFLPTEPLVSTGPGWVFLGVGLIWESLLGTGVSSISSTKGETEAECEARHCQGCTVIRGGRGVGSSRDLPCSSRKGQGRGHFHCPRAPCWPSAREMSRGCWAGSCGWVLPICRSAWPPSSVDPTSVPSQALISLPGGEGRAGVWGLWPANWQSAASGPEMRGAHSYRCCLPAESSLCSTRVRCYLQSQSKGAEELLLDH